MAICRFAHNAERHRLFDLISHLGAGFARAAIAEDCSGLDERRRFSAKFEMKKDDVTSSSWRRSEESATVVSKGKCSSWVRETKKLSHVQLDRLQVQSAGHD